jgi:hypothetical protein
MSVVGIPLAVCADRLLSQLTTATGAPGIARLQGETLLGERAMLRGMSIPGRVSAGGGCRLFDAVDDRIALNLARASDRELLPALFEMDELNPTEDEAIVHAIGSSNAVHLVSRGRSMGLAIAAENEARHFTAQHEDRRGVPGSGLTSACALLASGPPVAADSRRGAPRVLDLSALWAGPLAAHLLWLAGAGVVKLESRSRPDAMRTGESAFYALLNQGKASVALELTDPDDRQALRALIATSDIVIEAARPRALLQLGIDANEIVRNTPGLVWMTLTGHGTSGEAANWVGFGDDCGVSGGLSAALREVTGHSGFVGDAIADPLTGMTAALLAWQSWKAGRSGRFALAMSQVVAECLAKERERDAAALHDALARWGAAVGQPFPTVRKRVAGLLPAFGAHTRDYLT